MADFRRPRVASGANDNGQRKKMKASADDRPTDSSGRADTIHRSRNTSGDSADNNPSRDCRSVDERYQDDGHLGSLRSPLRTDIDVMGRSRGLRSRDQMRMHSYQHQRRCSRQADEVAEETSLKWQLDSLSDFPALRGHPPNPDSAAPVHRAQQGERAARYKCQLYTQDTTNKAADQSSGSRRHFTREELATDEVKSVLARRQKQIDYGKNTECYAKYVHDVPRGRRTKAHPSTPNKHLDYTRRGWDMLVKIWRKKLHYWDPTSDSAEAAADTSLTSSTDVCESEEGADAVAAANDNDDEDNVFIVVNAESDDEL